LLLFFSARRTDLPCRFRSVSTIPKFTHETAAFVIGESRQGSRGPSGGHRNLGLLKGDGAGVTHHTGTDLDQLQLQARQQLVGHRLEQFDVAQEGGLGVGKRVPLQLHLDVLLGGVALVIEAHHLVRLH